MDGSPAMPASGTSKRRRSILDGRYSVHWTIITALVSILIGVGGTIFASNLATQKKGIAYEYPFIYTLFSPDMVSPKIKVYDSENQPIHNRIRAVRFTMWNYGNVPVEPDDIRDQMKLVLWPVQKIIDIQVLHEVRPEIAKYTISEVDITSNTLLLEKYKSIIPAEEKDSTLYLKAIAISWDHLDPGFGISFQVTYVEGETKESWAGRHLVDGYIFGIPSFVEADTYTSYIESPTRRLPSILLTLGLVLLFIIFLRISLSIFLSERSYARIRRSVQIITVISTTGLLLFAIGYILWAFWINTFNAPPIAPF